MNFEAVLFIGNHSETKLPLNLKTSIDWLETKGFHNYVDIYTNANRPINLLEVLKQNNKLNGNDLLTLFGHVEILNQNLTRRHENLNRPQSTMITKTTPNPTSPKFKRDRWSCRLDSSKKPDPFTENKNHQSFLEIEPKINNSLHTFKSSSLRHMSHRNTQLDSVCKNNLHSANEIDFKRKIDSKSLGINVDDMKNLIGCTKHHSLTTVMEQSITDESTNQNQAINENYSQLISSISDSNSISSLDSNAKSVRLKNSSTNIQSVKQPSANLTMKSNLSANIVPEISVASNISETPNLSPRCCSNDSDFLLPTTGNVNLRISNDVPRSTGSNRRYFNSWGYDFELDSGVEELSNDSIDMGEAGRINFRTGSFMTRYRRNSKLSNSQSSPRSVLISPSQHCVNWAWCKDENNQPIIDNVEDELNPVLDSLFSDMDSLDNFRNILHNRRISNNFEEFNSKETCKKELRPKDFIIRKPHLHNEKSNIDKNVQTFEDIENRQQTNSLTRQGSENKFKKSSLKKSASARKRNHPFRWSSLARTNQPVNSCRDLELSHLSLNQFLILKKLAMLRLTSLLESHIPSQKSQFNWKFPKLLSQKSKFTDTSTSVFGASLSYWQGRIGQPLPPVIYHALKYIRTVGPESDGIFRRAGGKARITELKKAIEKTQDMTDFSKWQPYDVADMIKSYFRSLPECLMTNKLSSTLISIKTYIPEQNWFEAIQWVIINLPDENRLVLQSLLYFLSDLTKHSKTTQMTSYNLAVCLSPSLFHSPHVINSSSVSPIRMRKSIHGPDPRDLEDQKATHHCLKFMIDHAPSLFRLSEETINKARIQMEFERIISLSKLLRDCNDWYSWIRSKVEALINENNHKFKNWTSARKDILKLHNDKSEMLHGFELFYKKNNAQSDKSSEGINSIGTWRITAEIDAPASLILDKIQNSRQEWDLEIAFVRIKREISDSVDICYMEVVSNPPQTQRQMTLIRGCQRNIDGNINVLVSQSVDDNSPVTDRKPLKQFTHEDHDNDHDYNVINVLQDDVIIEYFPASQKSRINWLSRVDLRGFSSEWYFRQWSHVLIRRLIHLKVACAQMKI